MAITALETISRHERWLQRFQLNFWAIVLGGENYPFQVFPYSDPCCDRAILARIAETCIELLQNRGLEVCLTVSPEGYCCKIIGPDETQLVLDRSFTAVILRSYANWLEAESMPQVEQLVDSIVPT